jgi:hypothetical protein
MFHTIVFAAEIHADLETSPKHLLGKVRIRPGASMKAQIKPYVVDGNVGPIEVADLFFEDGSAIRRIPFKCFYFVE